MSSQIPLIGRSGQQPHQHLKKRKDATRHSDKEEEEGSLFDDNKRQDRFTRGENMTCKLDGVYTNNKQLAREEHTQPVCSDAIRLGLLKDRSE